MNKHIVVLPGDGIGPEVTQAAAAVLTAVGQHFGHDFIFESGLIGAAAIAATGDPFPEVTQQQLTNTNAVLLGAVGLPEYDNDPSRTVRPEQGLLRLRKHLGVFANIRPVTVWPAVENLSSLKPGIVHGVDMIFFRELLGGLYFGQPSQRSTDGNSAVDTMSYTRVAIQRIVRLAFQTAQQRRKQLCSIDKANVLACSRLWREVVQDEAKNFPDVLVTHLYVDNAAMQLINNPRQFDVIVTENMFGDILTDEAAAIVGSIGLLPSASLGESIGLYEPIHGSAPDLVGKNTANPIGAILSAAMLLEYSFGLNTEAKLIRQAVAATVSDQLHKTSDITQQIINRLS